VNPEVDRIRDLLMKNVEELELSVRSANCLRAANIKTIGDLVRKPEAEMLKYRNFGRKSLKEISDILAEMGLHFGMDVTPYLGAMAPTSALPPSATATLDEDFDFEDDEDDEDLDDLLDEDDDADEDEAPPDSGEAVDSDADNAIVDVDEDEKATTKGPAARAAADAGRFEQCDTVETVGT